ncbi:type II toxin-antitoxin system HicB family antitoxin [Natrinema salsiterrestre]|uniref:Type II toxin-antitoxin system HicB family antitoxin n=1 Tax=Natrinema salsiterrestre TaxID=2950540 RepID=A0A9Q4L0K1_9EURY|nr:type II toxin-antitoxin system HicB family antitoxin [Natrinema salsiterrestre]MDF9747623.1 type II toxin-antitoxin system HicB family antitoxin [Natrinema salsiterrestre]
MSSDADVDPSDYEGLEDADVTMRVNDHGLHIADDEETGVSSQGQTPEEALANLAEAVQTYTEATSDDPGDDWL